MTSLRSGGLRRETELARSRRRRRMRRRSRSDAPPHTPCSMRFTSAYSRHSACTGHVAHTRCAVSTPVPSDGKNSAGLIPRHVARNIHAYSSGVSSTATSISTNPTAVWFPWFTSRHVLHNVYGIFMFRSFTRSRFFTLRPWSTTHRDARKLRPVPRSVRSVNSQMLRETLGSLRSVRCGKDPWIKNSLLQT